jgi:hypothetical protein
LAMGSSSPADEPCGKVTEMVEQKIGEFHTNNGLTFRRTRIERFMDDGKPDVEVRAYSANGHIEGVLLHRWLLTDSEFASVMAHLSRRGETERTYRQALDFLNSAVEPGEEVS